MQTKKHIYSFTYDNTESELCKLESKYVFNEEEKNRFLFSDIKVEPSSSAFIKSRLDLISSSEDYSTLINDIKKEEICMAGTQAVPRRIARGLFVCVCFMCVCLVCGVFG